MKVNGFVGLTAMLAVLVALLVARWPSMQAQPVASIALPPPGAAKQLYPGCNNIALTFPDGTSSMTVFEAVTPEGSVEAIWRHNAAERRWAGFSSAATGANDLLSVDFLDAVWLCLARAPTPTPAATATPTTGATLPAPASATATPTPTGTTSPVPGTPTATPPPASQTPVTARRPVFPTDALASFRYSTRASMDEGAGLLSIITSQGEFVAPDRLSCGIDWEAEVAVVDVVDLAVIGNQAWINMFDTGWTATTADGPEIASYLPSCPSSRLFWETLGLPADLGSIPGTAETVNGVPAVRLPIKDLVQAVPLPLFGVPITTGEGLTVNYYDVWLALDGDWVVALEFDAEIHDSSGGGGEGDVLRIGMRLDVTDANDPSISVVPPI